MLTRRKMLGIMTVTPAAAAIPSIAFAREPEVFQNPVAINGIDAVAYFQQQRPVSGEAAYARRWNGAQWHFVNQSNAEAFAANPQVYAPVFGGYCAFAASRGYLAPTIPEAWTIYEGRLYLNASLRARRLWLRDVPGNIADGLRNWPGILG